MVLYCLRVVHTSGSLKVCALPLPALSLVLGGAASGKSRFAEGLCFQDNSPRVYIATAQAFDDEMREKIENHKNQRGPDWHTIEAITDVATALGDCADDQVVLLDCATLWLTNVVLAEQDVIAAENALLAALGACPARVVVVSNEVGQGIVPDSKLGRAFRNHQGRLNQKLAAQAGLVVNVIAGLPQVLKGDLP